MAGWTPEDRLRGLLGELIPEGGSDADTFFTDAQIDDFVAESTGLLNRAAVMGWEMKAAYWAGLITVTEGNASRLMSDMYDHAQKMIKYFSTSVGNDLNSGRARVGKIRRRN